MRLLMATSTVETIKAGIVVKRVAAGATSLQFEPKAWRTGQPQIVFQANRLDRKLGIGPLRERARWPIEAS